MQRKDHQNKRAAKKAKRALAHKESVRARNAAKLGVKRKDSLPAPLHTGHRYGRRARVIDSRSSRVVGHSASEAQMVNRAQVVQHPDGTTDVQIAQAPTNPADTAKTLSELKALAKEHGVKGYSKYKKADIEALRDLVREAAR